MDSHRRPPQTSCVCLRTHTNVLCVLTDTHERPTHTDTTDVLCVLTDSHKQPQTSCVCWRTPTDVLYSPRGPKSPEQSTGRVSMRSQRTNVLIYSARGPKSPKQSTGRASVLSPRTSVLICVLMDCHGYSPRGPKSPKQSTGRASVQSSRTNVLISTDVLCMLTDTHGRSVCADRHPRTSCPRTSCVCWRTPMDVLCVLNRQPTWDKITQTVHGKGQRAESNDQRADMCTEGQPRTSCVPRGPKSPEQSTRRVSVRSPRTNVVICVLMDSHGCHVCADGQTRTHTDIHVQPRTSNVC
ncbi:unnamed protein product [Brassica rapa]|uniref:Uncharacterized protein n=1 Tax=Brassica campestris TaxID=3711 RepID=A0A8D9D4J7_BRACM|nr:unnamed protein product [Brassica rapa]